MCLILPVWFGRILDECWGVLEMPTSGSLIQQSSTTHNLPLYHVTKIQCIAHRLILECKRWCKIDGWKATARQRHVWEATIHERYHISNTSGHFYVRIICIVWIKTGIPKLNAFKNDNNVPNRSSCYRKPNAESRLYKTLSENFLPFFSDSSSSSFDVCDNFCTKRNAPQLSPKRNTLGFSHRIFFLLLLPHFISFNLSVHCRRCTTCVQGHFNFIHSSPVVKY